MRNPPPATGQLTKRDAPTGSARQEMTENEELMEGIDPQLEELEREMLQNDDELQRLEQAFYENQMMEEDLHNNIDYHVEIKRREKPSPKKM